MDNGALRNILITGMSGTGKSAVIEELARRGFTAIDLDSNEYSHWVEIAPETSMHALPAPGRDWRWREDRVAQLLDARGGGGVQFVSGCAENMGRFLSRFEHVVLLSAPAETIEERLRTRTGNSFGKSPAELAQVMRSIETVEPLLRRIASHEIDARRSLLEVADEIAALARPLTNG